MSLCPRRKLLPLLVLLWLGLPAPARATGGIEDGAGLFKEATRAKADDAIDEIHRRTHKDFFIETVNKLSPEDLKQYRDRTTDAQCAEFFRDLAEKRARHWEVNGVYVLLCRVPAVQEPRKGFFHFIPRTFQELFPPQVVGRAVVVWPPSDGAYFPKEDRIKLDGMFAAIRVADHNQDAILLDAVRFVGEVLETNARALGAPPADTFRWTSVLWVVAALAGAWAVLGILRAGVAGRQVTPAPGASQALAALYGLAGVLWLVEAYRSRRQQPAALPVPQQPPAGPAPDADEFPADGAAMHPDDLEAIARGPTAWTAEDTEATTGHDRP